MKHLDEWICEHACEGMNDAMVSEAHFAADDMIRFRNGRSAYRQEVLNCSISNPMMPLNTLLSELNALHMALTNPKGSSSKGSHVAPLNGAAPGDPFATMVTFAECVAGQKATKGHKTIASGIIIFFITDVRQGNKFNWEADGITREQVEASSKVEVHGRQIHFIWDDALPMSQP